MPLPDRFVERRGLGATGLSRQLDAWQLFEGLDVRGVGRRILPRTESGGERCARCARELLLVQKEDSLLAGLELGSMVPAHVAAAGETNGDLVIRMLALDHLADIDDGLAPERCVLADPF